MALAPRPVLGIDPKMYRHFAAITIAITAAVAIFADSGDPNSQVVQMQEAAQLAAKKNAAAMRERKTTTLVDNRRAPSRASADVGAYGQPMDGSSSDSGLSGPPALPAGAWDVQVRADPAVLARMSPEQRAAYLRSLEVQRRKLIEQGPYRPSTGELASLRAASALRSGAEAAD